MIASKIRSSVIRAAVAATACALALAGCSSSSPGAKGTSGAASSAAPTAGGTLHVVRAESFDGWDPDASSAYSSYQTVYAVLEPLVRFGSDGRALEPGIATKWSYDKAATSWTFTLRDDVTFSDAADRGDSGLGRGRQPGHQADAGDAEGEGGCGEQAAKGGMHGDHGCFLS